ncbi:MAG TPA: hypothetical protein VHU41_09575 [Thermoanaerobaculia bacterium]|jgi:2-phosphoglycerate kinase|nr:hypothetical protein [Thermoanaerobaculia bacterium]
MTFVAIGVALFVAVGVAMIVARKPLADGQAIVFGGSVVPGCVIAEAIAMFVAALLMIVAYRYGLFR